MPSYGIPVPKTAQEKIQDVLDKALPSKDAIIHFSLSLKEPMTGADAAFLGENIAPLPHTGLSICCDTLNNEGLEVVAPYFAKMPNLTKLNLDSNDFNSSAILALNPVLQASKIQELSLADNELYSSSVSSLARILPKTQIKTLKLGRNNIDNDGFVALGENLGKSKLETLEIFRNNITSKDVVAFAPYLPESRLKILQMNFNKAGVDGAKALADVLPRTSLEKLSLSENKIGDEGVKAISKVLASSKIQDLDFFNNDITDEGAKHLLIAVQNPNCKLVALGINNNQISPDLMELLKKAVENNQIRLQETEKAKEQKAQEATLQPNATHADDLLIKSAYAGTLADTVKKLTDQGKTPSADSLLIPDEYGCTPLSLTADQGKLSQLITPDHFKNAQEVQKIWNALPVGHKDQLDGKEGRPSFMKVKNTIMANAVKSALNAKKSIQR